MKVDAEECSAAPAYVGFWPRVVATVIDTLLIALLVLPLLAIVYGAHYFTLERALSGSSDLRETVISAVLPAAAVLAFWRSKAATPGKMAIGARIVDARSLGRPTLGQLAIRYLGYYVAALPLGLGLVWVAFDPRRQGWHDKLAGTVVVRVRH